MTVDFPSTVFAMQHIMTAAMLRLLFVGCRICPKHLPPVHALQWIEAREAASPVIQDIGHVNRHALTPGCARRQMAIAIIVMVCIFTSGFAWSWGPLGWLVPSEIQPLETRSTGQAITVSTNFIFTAVIGQAFLTMLCTMQVHPWSAQFAPCEPAQSV